MKITRRQLMKYSAAMAAASTLGFDFSLPGQVLGGTEADVDLWTKGVCRYCGAGCGLYVGSKGGKVTAVKGDKENWNKGFLCLKGNFLPAIMTAPDRAKYPLLNKNGKFVVRRDKALFFSGCESRPATFVPAGSNWSRRGGNEASEAFGVDGSSRNLASMQAVM